MPNQRAAAALVEPMSDIARNRHTAISRRPFACPGLPGRGVLVLSFLVMSAPRKRLDSRPVVLFPMIGVGSPGVRGHLPASPKSDVLPGNGPRSCVAVQPVVERRAAHVEVLGALLSRDLVVLEKVVQQGRSVHCRDMLMNLNRGATEIVTSVQPGEQYAAGMADPEDDRGEALAWYVRLLVRQELDRGTERKELLRRLGIQKGHLSQIERGKLGVGVPKLIQFAAAFGYTPGVLLDRALSWWQSQGRQERARILLEAATDASRAAPESGEHPSQSPLKAAK